MNALQKDLIRLVPLVEEWGRVAWENDPTRLRFHLMPPVGWLNDPNGLCWYKGNYHVFYQYGPFDPKGGVKFWGHWTSPDLLNWKQQPVAMCPDETWDIHGVYSGSALVEDDALYLYYTGNVKHPGDYDYIYEGRGHNVGLGISRDGVHVDSKTLLLENKDYPSDVSCHVRDPKVWKQEDTYYMVLGARTREDRGELLVYESKDRLHWALCNTITTPEPFGYMWECPDLFCVDGQWILSLSPQGLKQDGYRYQNVYSCGYLPLYGDFRGDYTLGDYVESDVGFDYYAPQTFVAPDGRRIVIGWMGMPDATYTNPTADASGWQHCMSVPRELHWNGEKLLAAPVRELEQLRENGRTLTLSGRTQMDRSESADLVLDNTGDALTIAIGSDAVIEWKDGLLTLTLSESAGYGRTQRFLPLDKLSNLRLLLDTTTLELFVNDGEQTMTMRYYPTDAGTLTIEGQGSAQLYELRPMTFESGHKIEKEGVTVKRVVAIGELLIDFVPGEKGCALREVTHFERVAGGAPANVVTAVSRLGGRGAMVSQVGDDAFGEHIIDVLKNSGVDTTYVFKTKKANTGLAFVSLDATGNREFSFFRNPSADLYLSPEQITPDMLADAGIVHFCSVDLVDWPVRKAHERLIQLAQEKNVIVSFDPNVRLPLWDSPADCQKTIREFLPLADVVKLSDDELEFVTGCADEAQAAEKLLSGKCRMLILTKGGNGSSVYTRNATAHVPAISVETVVDTTGAGDSFAGSFLFQLVQKQCTLETLDDLTETELQEMIRFSSRYAALTIGKKGAVMADMQEMNRVYGLA